MEEYNDQPVPTPSARIHTNTKITGTQPTTNITIPNSDKGNGTIKIPPRRSLQVPPSRRG